MGSTDEVRRVAPLVTESRCRLPEPALGHRLVLPLVFVAGMTSLGIEFGASRLLAPYFGTSLYVWGVLIGLILIYLSVGYLIGGRLADRHPDVELLFQLTAWAGLWIGAIPLVSYPILLFSQRGFGTLDAGLVLGSLLAVVALFAVPVTLLGCVSPFAIRLLLKDVSTGGNTSGSVYALSTVGSILGTFLTVFWLIPTYGTRSTIIGFSLALLALSIAGLWPRKKYYLVFAFAVALAWVLLPPHIKPPAYGTLRYETESAYNYIQVIQVGSRTELVLNEGQAVHSIYEPALLTGGYWDYFLLAPSFQPAQSGAPRPHRIAIIGLAGGTAARLYTAAFGPHLDIIGVEIDPALIAVGRGYFHMNESNLHAVVQDGRYWLATQRRRYDVILVDAFRQPYIPFYLTTREFFRLVRYHLNPRGTVVVNVGRTATDNRLVAAIASTMAPEYPNVYLVDVPASINTLVYGTTRPTSLADIRHNLALMPEPLVRKVALSAEAQGRLRPSPYHGPVYTDDLAPIERLIDDIILGYVRGNR